MKKNVNIYYISLIGLLVIIILFLSKCSKDKIHKLEHDNFILQNNIEVVKDSVLKYKTKNGYLVSERGVLIATKNNLSELSEQLSETVNNLQKELKVKPTFVVDYKTKIVHDTIYLDSKLNQINDSLLIVLFKKDTIYDVDNSRKLQGEIHLKLNSSDTKYNIVSIQKTVLTRDEINLQASLVLGLKDKKLKVWVVSKYPGFDTERIDAVILDPKIHPELRKLNKEKFSIGPFVGIGLNSNLRVTPVVGIGLQYKLIKF
jgi:hypothetical protein